jgi:hypothetical protein
MDKTDPLNSFGIFKPVGHTPIAFRPARDPQAAVAALRAQGFAASAMVPYGPEEMKAQVAADLEPVPRRDRRRAFSQRGSARDREALLEARRRRNAARRGLRGARR